MSVQPGWYIIYVVAPIGSDHPGQNNKIVQTNGNDANAKLVEESGPAAKGPFESQASAQAFLKGESTGVHNPSSAGAIGDVLGVGDAIAKLTGAISGFFHVVTDVTLWRSLGWVALGAFLMFLGVSLWLKLPQKAAKVAEVAAVA